ncbi:MAG: hypothetical protein EZS28_022882 [Streblomastix strix]|uniref:Uncharacterized protein n=1 Tax=Streblomastix strix TaxID=222440 RepID=A0A5J4VGD5_9EUKA|nr:MAG: hypothetical protein EZS28_022882 [Streblomastix strix]
MRAPTTIRNQMDLAEYNRSIRNLIILIQERTNLDTKEKIVGAFSVMIQVFRLLHAGAGGDIKEDGAVAAKCYMEHSRIVEAKRIFQRIYGKKIVVNYQGFNFATEAEQFVLNENLNIIVFAYEEIAAISNDSTVNSGSYL